MKSIAKRFMVWTLSLAMLLAFMPLLGSASYADESTVKTIKVSVLTQKDENKAWKAFPELTVKADAAESYGFAEPEKVRDPDESAQYPLANEVTTLDVLVEVTHQLFGDAFTAETASNYLVVNSSGTIKKIFGEETTLSGFTVNGENPLYKGETTFGKTGSLIDDSIVEDGDSLRFFRTFDEGMGMGGLFSSMMFFDGADIKSYSLTSGVDALSVDVSVDYAFANMLEGMGGGPDLSPEDIEISLIDSVGNVAAKDVTNASGKVEFPYVKAGDYTLVVSAYEGNMYDDHFVTPYATVKVTEPKEVSGTIKVAVRNFEAADQFDVIPQKVKVSSKAAESYGDMGDRENGSGNKITVADVLYTLHAQKYGSKFNKESVGDYIVASGGWLSRNFGVDTTNQVYFINNNLTMSGSIYTIALKDGDNYDHFMCRDGYNDVPTCFKEDGITVNKGEAFSLNLQRVNWDGTTGVLKGADNEEVVAAIMDNAGKLTPISGAKMDNNGAVSLSLNETGTFEISATGKAKGEYVDAKIVAPHCTVTVIDPNTGKEEAKPVKTVTLNVKTVNKKAIDKAVAKAGGTTQSVTTIVIGKKAKKISKGAFSKYKNATTLQVKSKKLTKKSVKGSLKGSKIKTVKVKVGSKKANKKYVKKYKKIFTKKNAGKKVKVTR